jgi:hypothetical protein
MARTMFSAIPSPDNSARPLEKSNPKGLQDELVRHIKEDNLMSWFDFAVQFLDTGKMTYWGKTRDANFWIESASVAWNEAQAPYPHGCEAYSSEELAFVIGSKRSDIFR